MPITVDENSLKEGILGLVIALVEIIADALKTQAVHRVASGSLSEEECERLGKALMDLDAAIEQIKEEQAIKEAVQSVRDGLDNIVDEMVNRVINPEYWQETKN